jgi:hypothetical protein
VVHENAAHLAGRDRKEMGAVLPGNVHFDELYERFVDNGGCLKRVTGSFSTHIAPRTIPQLLIDEGGQSLQSVRVARAPRRKQARDGLSVRWLDRRCDCVAQDCAPRGKCIESRLVSP